MKIIDLRSDTVTKPTPGMRRVMAEAAVGDDVYAEDPSVKQLETTVASLLGKEAALFVPSGTMGNQIALLLHTRPGDEVVIGEGNHTAWYESGAGAAIAGVQFIAAGSGGIFSARELEFTIKPRTDYYPRTSLVSIENTHNRAGGKIFPQALVEEVASTARARGLALHLDGARIWNAAAKTGLSLTQLAAPFDTINVCFSKGLGAPVGSALVGSTSAIAQARRLRKMLGGGMRQVGILAAAAAYALEHHRTRLHDDHTNAATFGALVSAIAGVTVHPVETNIVLMELDHLTAEQAVQGLAREGVLLGAMGPRLLRAVTHLDVSHADVTAAAEMTARFLTTTRE